MMPVARLGKPSWPRLPKENRAGGDVDILKPGHGLLCSDPWRTCTRSSGAEQAGKHNVKRACGLLQN
jgi:hypothetical protein